MNDELNGKVALVTGGARGLGGAIAEKLSAAGATVTIGDVLDSEAAELASRLAGPVDVAHLDVTDEENWRSVVGAVQDKHGKLDVLVNNAGIVGMAGIVEEDRETWDRILAVNLTGVFLGMREVIPGMRDRGEGSIINISSTWGLVGAPGAAAYHASKGGVTVLTKNAAVTYAEHGIRVNSIHPGPMQTPIAIEVGEEGMAATAARTPLGRVADPAEVAGAAVYFASDSSRYTTGAGLAVDGGYTAI